MRKRLLRPTFLGLSSAALLLGCSTELDINDEYKDVTIVYGLLNQRDSLHFLKINKAFLGEGDAFQMALVADSSEYRGEAIQSAVVERVNAAGAVVETYTLRDTLVSNREPGTFYAPEQKLYYFRTPFAQELPPGTNGTPMYLWQDDTYRLSLVVNGRAITATAPITNDYPIDAVDFNTEPNQSSNRVRLRNDQGTSYVNYEFNWKSRADCKRYEVSYRFRYDEVVGGDTIPKSITRRIGTKVSSFQNEDMAILLSGESFFSAINSQIKSEPGWQNATRRIFRGLDFLTTVANDDYHIYLTLSEPVTGIVNERPVYSNIDGAYGGGGSRYTKAVIGKRLSTQTLEELKNGPYTADLLFCSALDPGGAYSCD